MKPILLGALILVLAGSSQAGIFMRSARRDGIDKTETRYLKTLPDVQRKGDVLSIHTTGKAVEFKNDDSNGESFGKCALVGYFDLESGRKDYLVFLQLYEGSRMILVNGRTGDKLTLQAEPVLSPDKKNYLVASMDLDAGYASNDLSIYGVETFSPVFAFSWPNRDPAKPMKGPDEAVWASNKKITFVEVTRSSDLSKKTEKSGPSWTRSPMYFETRGEKWVGPLNAKGEIESPQKDPDTGF